MDSIRTFACLLLNFFLVTCELPVSSSTTVDGQVIGISDGDTFTMLIGKEQVKVRLYGIDCPEKKQDYGQAAKQKLSDLIFGKQVRTVKKSKDRYGRTVALVYDQYDHCINEEMLKAGLAWHYTKYDTNPFWQELEAAARKKQLGLWSKEEPTPPWQWRRK